MARQKSPFLSAFGVVFEIWKELVEAVIAKGGTDDDLRRILTDKTLRDKIADLIVTKVAEVADFFTPVSDKDLADDLRETATKWRRLAAELGYAGPVAWQVRAGFTLKQDAPKAGPCYKGFAYLQDWALQNDEPTRDSVVFWIPRLLPGSTVKTADEQKLLLAEFRQRYDLPAAHLASFGSAALLAGLILAHFKITGGRVPLDCYWSRTETLYADGNRLDLGSFGADGLYCRCYWHDSAHDNLGCFALGV